MTKLKNWLPKRINLKINLDFWAIIGYVERVHYVIDNVSYTPVSYRWLCFAVIVVKHSNELKNEITSPELAKFVESNDKTNNIRRRKTSF